MSPQTVSRTGRPPRLTQSEVVTEARQVGAQQGIERLTMRRLADALGVRPNSIYTYFPNKAAVLDAILDDLLGDVEPPRPEARWRPGLAALMSSYRRLLLSQPGLVSLTVSRPMLGPNALRLREAMLALLTRGGLGSRGDRKRVPGGLRVHDRLRRLRGRPSAGRARRRAAC